MFGKALRRLDEEPSLTRKARGRPRRTSRASESIGISLERSLLAANVSAATFGFASTAEASTTPAGAAAATTERPVLAEAARSPTWSIVSRIDPECATAELEPVETLHCSSGNILRLIGNEGESAHPTAFAVRGQKDLLDGSLFCKERFELFFGCLKTEISYE